MSAASVVARLSAGVSAYWVLCFVSHPEESLADVLDWPFATSNWQVILGEVSVLGWRSETFGQFDGSMGQMASGVVF